MERECPFCAGRRTSGRLVLRERFFGMGTQFAYAVCAECGSIYILDPAIDLKPYYPETYYSYAPEPSGIFGHVLRTLFATRARRYLHLIRSAGVEVNRQSTIVDAGSGSGTLLRAMRRLGYRNVRGLDPYLPADVDAGDIEIARESIESAASRPKNAGSAKVVMFHHTLEHMEDPVRALRAAAALVSGNGAILVRLPIVAYAWERYRECWFALDAPRHLAIPTERAMKRAAERAGLHVALVRYDSTALQFIGSETYVHGRSFVEAFPSRAGMFLRVGTSVRHQLHARWLNWRHRGDEAGFVLVPAVAHA